jgi:paraquat-inducible protein B
MIKRLILMLSECRQIMHKTILILLVLALAFLGCKEGDFNIKIRCDQIQGLTEGDQVIFEQNRIGKVTGVFYSVDGDYMVDLAIKEDFANAVTEYSEFFIIGDPQNGGKKAIEMIHTRTGGSPLKDGAIIEGSTKSSAVFSRMEDDLEKGLEDLKEHFERFFEDLRGVPESQEFKKLEKELERLTEEMKRSGKSAQEKIQKELLPRLKQEIEKLRKQLRRFGREKELEPLETQMKKIKEI